MLSAAAESQTLTNEEPLPMHTPFETDAGAQVLADLVAYQPGAVVSRMLLKKPVGSVTMFAFGKGEGLSEHTTPHDALLLVVDGEAEITVGGTAHRVLTGEVLLLPAGVPHAVQATGAFKMLLIMLKGS